jgi:hypothetical protein
MPGGGQRTSTRELLLCSHLPGPVPFFRDEVQVVAFTPVYMSPDPGCSFSFKPSQCLSC